MDSHHKHHIAHGIFWRDRDGNCPGVFSMISAEDVKSGKWYPREDLVIGEEGVGKGPMVDPEIFPQSKELFDKDGKFDLKKYCELYTELLESKGKFQLTIWPEHCLIGSPGHNVVPCVNDAMDEWMTKTGKSIQWVLKGQNLLTENYSAFQAEVPISKMTSFDRGLFDELRQSDRILVAGQALSHCVNYTIRDLVEQWPEEERNKIWILTDCCSNVPSFDEAGCKFIDDMTAAGCKAVKSSEVFS